MIMNTKPTSTARQLFMRRLRWKLAAVGLCLIASGATAQDMPLVTQRLDQQMQAIRDEKAMRNPREKKMDSQLVFAARQKRDGVAHKALPELRVGVKFERDGRAQVDIRATVSESLLAAIRAAGGEIVNRIPEENAVRAILPVERIEQLASRDDVAFIRPASIGLPNTGSVNSQGDATHRAGVARSTYGATGNGVKVGVLSDSLDDSFGSLQAAINSGDLDPNKTFKINGQEGQGEGEGLAMMEIVHDLAPQATIYFATANGGQAQMAANIRALKQNGCKIIIDDYCYADESPFQDDVIAKAVNDVSAAGVLYFSCAANSGNLQSGNSGTWEGDFVAGGTNKLGSYHNFKPGVSLNTVTEESTHLTVLFWSDPLGKSANDYDLVVYDTSGNIVALSNNVQNGSQDPIEGILPPKQGERLAIYKYSGQVRYLHLDTIRGRLAVGTAGAVRGHNASGAANAFCVAAAPAAAASAPGEPAGPFPNPYNTNSKVETFSCDGFRRIFYNAAGGAITPGNFTHTGGRVLMKPDITAADGVSTTLPPSSGLNPFFGTSAAAPHAGAIAALVLSAKLTGTPAQVRAALNSSTIDILVSGFDRASGKGIIMAPRAVQAILAAASSQPATVDSNGESLPDNSVAQPADGIDQ
jgi:hypothetical protein